MPAITSAIAFVGNHRSDGDSPDDPGLFSIDEIMAYAVPSTVASAATSTVTSQVASGGLGSIPISTADSKAVSSGLRGSVADSKALSTSSNASVADSKGVSNSVNISIADSKATSVATATIVPTVGGIPGFQQPYSTAVLRTANAKMADALNIRDFGATGTGDDTTAIQRAITAGASRVAPVVFPDGLFTISDEFTLSDNQTIILSPGTKITQTTANKNFFKATLKDNVWIHCNGAVLYGLGNWSAAWSEIATHQERGIQFLGCTNSGVTHPRIRNVALAGIVILGGTNITIDHAIIEGTHALSAPLTSGVSIYQFGILVQHDVTYGAYKNVTLNCPTIYNVAIGINSVMNTVSDGQLTIVAPRVHTFVAEHGLYLGTSNTTVVAPTLSDCGLDGIKIYSGAANENLENVTITDFNISNCPQGQAVEFGVSGSGSIKACSVSGVATDCARVLTVDGDVRGLKARIEGDRLTQYALYLSGTTGPSDCDFDVTSRDAQLHGVLVDSAGSTRNRLRAKVTRPGQGGGAFGIYISACTDLTLESPQCYDSTSFMQVGVVIAATATNVHITGKPRIKGYTTAAFKIDGAGAEWHASPGEFDAFSSAFSSASYQAEAPALLPVSELVIGRQSTTSSNVVLWNLDLSDESVYLVTARLVGKLSGSAQRGGYVTSALFYRDAAGVATLQGSSDEDVAIASGSFLGAYTWAVTANEARLNVNSGATANVDWIGRMTVTKIAG